MSAPLPVGGYPATPYLGYQLVPVRGPKNRVGITGPILTILGALITFIAMLLPWYSEGGGHVRLHDFQKGTSAAGAKALPHAYFGWLLWVVLALTIVAALLASLPSPLNIPLRIVSPLLGIVSIALLLISIGQLRDGVSVFHGASLGFWLVLPGFLITGVGGVLGPRRG